MLDVFGWFFLLCIDFWTWFKVLVSFCNEKHKRDQSTCSMLFYFCPATFCSCVKLNFACVESCFGVLDGFKPGDKIDLKTVG